MHFTCVQLDAGITSNLRQGRCIRCTLKHPSFVQCICKIIEGDETITCISLYDILTYIVFISPSYFFPFLPEQEKVRRKKVKQSRKIENEPDTTMKYKNENEKTQTF